MKFLIIMFSGRGGWGGDMSCVPTPPAPPLSNVMRENKERISIQMTSIKKDYSSNFECFSQRKNTRIQYRQPGGTS